MSSPKADVKFTFCPGLGWAGPYYPATEHLHALPGSWGCPGPWPLAMPKQEGQTLGVAGMLWWGEVDGSSNVGKEERFVLWGKRLYSGWSQPFDSPKT